MTATRPAITGIGTAVPTFRVSQDDADLLLTRHYKEELTQRSIDVLHQVFAHPGVRTRHLAVNSTDELIALKNEDPDKRIARFTEWSVRLSCEALTTALAQAGLGPGDLSVLIVNTCTGYICPGIATYLIERMGLRRSISVYDLVGAGCGGAVPNLQLAEQFTRNNPDAIAACVSVEISSAAFEMGNDIGLIVSNAIFGDGAAAVILQNREKGLSFETGASAFFPESREFVRFIYRQGRLFNRLDPQLPRVIQETAPAFFRKLLAEKNLTVRDVGYFALHPGGDKILTVIQEELGLTNADMAYSRSVLSRFGNMSSPTVLFVLREIIDQGVAPGSWCLLAAYGAGLSIYGYLLHQY